MKRDLERIARRVHTARALVKKATTPVGLSAANDVYLRALTEWFIAAGKFGADVSGEHPKVSDSMPEIRIVYGEPTWSARLART